MVDKQVHPGSAARDEAALEPFFAAARAVPDVGPTTRLLSAVLADAAAVTAERQAPVAVVGRREARFRLVGGWRGLAALAACAVAGFWIGLAGEVPIDTIQSSWTSYDASSDAGDTGAEDQLGAFYDLASVEG